jgi:hypothetical protein
MSNGQLGMSKDNSFSEELTEVRILEAIKKLLTKRVNEILANLDYQVPFIELSNYEGGNVVASVINLSTCERSEKERIIRLDAYSVSITFSLPEKNESEFLCYVYSLAVYKALGENPTLDGVADRAVATGKKYNKPKKPGCGEGWEVVISLRVTVEEIGNAG